MYKFTLILFCFIFIACNNEPKETPKGYVDHPTPEGIEPAETNYYFIRHAEKRTDQGDDPILIEAGTKRAIFWGEFFKEKSLSAFYTTDYIRNYQTLIPIVHEYKGTPRTFDEKKDTLFTRDFWEETYGKNTVIVGHNNSTPQFVNEILREEKYTQIEDGVHGNLYKVSINKEGKIKDTLYSHEKFQLSEEALKSFEEDQEIEKPEELEL
ncbi:MAG: phosphoglycerate mutase family protein [Bacteroidota bacterium]